MDQLIDLAPRPAPRHAVRLIDGRWGPDALNDTFLVPVQGVAPQPRRRPEPSALFREFADLTLEPNTIRGWCEANGFLGPLVEFSRRDTRNSYTESRLTAMGQRGPAPEPAALRILKGETRPSQLKKAPESTDPPAMPDDLTSDAVKVWNRILGVSSHIGPRHAETFRQFCETVAAANAMKPKGTKEWRELVNTSTKLARELCLTPATGAGLATKPAASKLDKYVRAG